jgi:hypothetical protein
MVGMAVLFGAMSGAAAQSLDPASLIGGFGSCPSPALVWQHLLPLVPGQILVDRIHLLGGQGAPVQIADLGASVRVTAGSHVREYGDLSRDCEKRAQFAAVFVAIVAGAEPTAAGSPPAAQPPIEAVRAAPPKVLAAPPEVLAAPAVARLHLDFGVTADAVLGGAASTIAPGLLVRIAFGHRPLVPVVGLGVSGPFDLDAGGVGFHQWRATADVDVRTAIGPTTGRMRVFVELGAALELLADRATTLSVAEAQVSYAVGPRAAAGLLLATRRRWSPFFLLHAAWFPGAPEMFALPAGDLGRAAPWNLGATAGISWGLL